MERPNLFDFATSELSQDAVLAWLLQCGDCENKGDQLQIIGAEFSKLLIHKQIPYDKEILSVKASRQWMNIDVYAKVNNEILIAIEDKTNTHDHSNQLFRYKSDSEGWCKKNNYKPVFIYVKTFPQSKSKTKEIEEKGFSVVCRDDLIDFFERFTIECSTLFDYKQYLISCKAREDEFLIQPIKGWTYEAWVGFYQFLESKIEVQDWQYVPNPTGGFIGLWWHFRQWREFYVYLQIEQGLLCIKIGDVGEDQSRVRNEWYEAVIAKARSKGLNEIVKPARFGTGTYMTVAIIEPKFWLGEDDSKINPEEVVRNIKKYEEFLDQCLV